MSHRASLAIIDGRIMLSAQAQRAGSWAVDSRQRLMHRLMWHREVKRTGYCCDCIDVACEAFDVMVGQER